MTITIVIADDHVLFRQGLAALLREQPKDRRDLPRPAAAEARDR
jgi:DNA-binding NarL/FixJ family response regulator